METRNAKYNEHGTIDCEIKHQIYGWIPFTASPDDVEQHGKDIHAELLASGNIPAYVKSAQSIAAEIQSDKVAQKESLIREKVESLLTAEFAEIDAATTKASIKAVKLK